MALTTEYYSDHFAPAATGITAIQRSYKAPVGISHARLRYKVARVAMPITGQTIGDTVVMMKFKSGDRLIDILESNDGAGTAVAADLGLYQVDVDGSPKAAAATTADIDLFGSAVDLATADARVTAWTESGTLDDLDRGKTVWALHTIGATSTLTADPMIDYYLTWTLTAANTTGVANVVVEAWYTSGD